MEKGRNSGKMEKNHEIIDHLIRKARAEKASDIHISEGMPITEVCYACGFKNYSTFSISNGGCQIIWFLCHL